MKPQLSPPAYWPPSKDNPWVLQHELAGTYVAGVDDTGHIVWTDVLALARGWESRHKAEECYARITHRPAATVIAVKKAFT